MSGTTSTTAQLHGTLERMLDVLERERGAVADFRLDELGPLGDEKKRLIDELATLAHAARGETDPVQKARGAVLFTRMQTESRTNMLLLHTVRAALATSMGVGDESDLYTARARRQSAYAPRASRAY